LAADPAFKGLKATAVQGHEIDVTDSNIREDTSLIDVGPHSALRYNVVNGISDKLRNAWGATFARLHPFAYNRNIVDIEVRDRKGGHVMGISVSACATL
jgi:hypothetical protein